MRWKLHIQYIQWTPTCNEQNKTNKSKVGTQGNWRRRRNCEEENQDEPLRAFG